MNPRRQSYLIYVLLFVAIIAMVYFNFQQQNSASSVIPINELAVDIKTGIVREIVEDENQLSIKYASGEIKEFYPQPQCHPARRVNSAGCYP